FVKADVLERRSDCDDALVRFVRKTCEERPALETDRDLRLARALEQQPERRVALALVSDVDSPQLLAGTDRLGDGVHAVDDVVEIDVGPAPPRIYASTLHDVPSRESARTMCCSASASRNLSASAKSFDLRAALRAAITF